MRATDQPPPARPRPAVPDTVLPRPARPDTTPRLPVRPVVGAPRDSVTVTAPAAGQRADSGRRASIDSVKGISDSLRTRVRRDSVQAPLARAQVPSPIGVGPLYRWTRDSVFSTGAINLTDLLERVPGVTVFRSGFLASIQTVAYLGDVSLVRVFRDGVELDVVDPRAGRVLDVGDVQLTNAELILVERAAGELRVHIRTWATRSTTPTTRVDAFTGDEDTNLYRFFYGTRFGGGFEAQVGVQQFGTGGRSRRVGGGGNVLDALGRVGWARGQWSADAVYTRLSRQRDQTIGFVGGDSLLPPFDARRNEAYLRAAYGDPESTGLWVQAIANSLHLALSGTSQRIAIDSLGRRAAGTLVSDTLVVRDSAASRSQYVLAGGFTLRGARVSLTDRVRVAGGSTLNTPSVRAELGSRVLSLGVFAEHDAVGGYEVVPTVRRDTTFSPSLVGRARIDTLVETVTAGRALSPRRSSRVDVTARFAPLSWLAVLGAVSGESRRPGDTTAADVGVRAARVEAAVRLGGLWLSTGLVRRSADTLVAPRTYECLATLDVPCAQLTRVGEGAVDGALFGARGRYFKDVYVDATGVFWKTGGAYRPRYQLRAETGVQTRWLRRFPTGNFGFKLAVIDEYRSRALFPTDRDTRVDETPIFAAPTNVLTAQLEIRIQTGTLSYQLRNALNRDYELVPGLRMPGPVSYYGLRWTFFN